MNDDTMVIEYAKIYGVAPILQISFANQGDIRQSDIAHTILNNESLKKNIIESIINNVRKRICRNRNISLYVFPSDRQLYIDLLKEIAERISEMGLILFNTLIPNSFELISDIFINQEYAKTIDRLADTSIFFPNSIEWYRATNRIF